MLLAAAALPVHAQTDNVDPYRFWKWPAADAVALGKSMASTGVIYGVGGGVLLMLAAPHDPHVTAELSALPPAPADLVVRVIEEFGNVRAVRPVAGVIFLGSLITEDRRFQDAAFTSLEAIMFANVITGGLKSVFGRARPFQDKGAVHFDPFSGNTSFPSGHSTTAFAFVTPWLLYYPDTFTPGLLLLSAGTAFSRMLTQNHWFTDVVAGSTIGFATAYYLVGRHKDASRVGVAPIVSGEQVGITVSIPIE
ncbi:MAG: phosphatase PAP2 family protein [Rhodothermales bacterium]